MKNTIKIPQGEFTLIFDNGKGFKLTNEILLEALIDYAAKERPKPTDLTAKDDGVKYDNTYDDENPDYIKMSQEEI